MPKHGVLKHWHPMMGVDFHIPWPPGAPAAAPSPVPYFTVQIMNGLNITANKANDALSHYKGLTMLKVTDIGPFIGHVGTPSILLAFEIPGSWSKSYFGSSRCKSKGTPVAVALLYIVNLNLNCGTPIPTPTGRVLALTTHFVDMTFGDIISGVLQMAADAAIAAALNKLGSVLCGDLLGKAGTLVFNGIWTAMWFMIGTPTGMDAASFGIWGQDSEGNNQGGPGDIMGAAVYAGTDSIGQALGSYLDGTAPNGTPVELEGVPPAAPAAGS